MKKILFVACAACAISLASCCHKCENTQCDQDTVVLADTVVYETFDTVYAEPAADTTVAE